MFERWCSSVMFERWCSSEMRVFLPLYPNPRNCVGENIHRVFSRTSQSILSECVENGCSLDFFHSHLHRTQCQDIRTWLNLVTRVGIDTNLSMNSTTYRIVKLREFHTRFQLLQHGFVRLANRGVVGFDLFRCVHKDGSADLGTCVRACLSVGVSVTF